MSNDPSFHYAYFGGGCFWCLEAVYELEPGVVDVENGYAGGSTENPDYEHVSSGMSGHAEIVRIVYDPAKTSYERLLELFWDVHDPTTENRQGADFGTQYRSIILYADESQRALAEASMQERSDDYSSPIVTQIVPLTKYWKAEDYHQDYFRKHPDQAYCRIVIAPKVEKYLKTRQ